VSASEKLKALEHEQMLEGRYPDLPDGRERELLAALPQLVAVVEAAEQAINATGRFDIYDRTKADKKARAALAALNEALGDTRRVEAFDPSIPADPLTEADYPEDV
jgi:hypothetical protein